LDLNTFAIPINDGKILGKNKGKMIPKGTIVRVFAGVFG